MPAQAGIHGALASPDWIARLTRSMTRMILSVMLRVVAASRERARDSRLREHDDLFEFCGPTT